jgi:hypothetical protein
MVRFDPWRFIYLIAVNRWQWKTVLFVDQSFVMFSYRRSTLIHSCWRMRRVEVRNLLPILLGLMLTLSQRPWTRTSDSNNIFPRTISPIQNVHYEIQQRLYNAWAILDWPSCGTTRIREFEPLQTGSRIHLMWWPTNHPGDVTEQLIKFSTYTDILYVHYV